MHKKMAGALALLRNKRFTLIVFLSAAISLYYSFVSAPGVLYQDSFIRWAIIPEAILARSPEPIWLNPVPSLFMMLVYRLVGNYAFFTFIQSFAFFLTSFLLIEKLAGAKFFFAIILFINPVTIGYSVFGDMGILCLAGMNILILLCIFALQKRAWTLAEKIYIPLLFMGASFLLVGFRTNALTVLPLVLGISLVIIFKHKEKLKGVLIAAGSCAGVLLVLVIPQVLGINTYSAASAGFTWEILDAIHTAPREYQAEYLSYLDELGGDGATQAATAHRPENVNAFLGVDFGPDKIASPEASKIILSKYLGLAKEHPGHFMATKAYFWLRSLGISQPLDNADYYYFGNHDILSMGLNDTGRRASFVDNVNSFLDNIVVLRMPYIWFLAGLLASIYMGVRHKNTSVLLAFLFAVFYYAAFLVNTQAFQFRYFFPSFALLLVVVLVAALQLVKDLAGNNKKRAAASAQPAL